MRAPQPDAFTMTASTRSPSKASIVRLAIRTAQRPGGPRTLDLPVRGLAQGAVRPAGRAQGLARAAVRAEREVLDVRVGQPDPRLRERLDQEDAPARRVHLRAELRDRRPRC